MRLLNSQMIALGNLGYTFLFAFDNDHVGECNLHDLPPSRVSLA
jgi:hypothetical protein